MTKAIGSAGVEKLKNVLPVLRELRANLAKEV